MRVFMLARKPPNWVRVAFAALALAFALNSIAHTAHQHDPAPIVAAYHNLACGHCAMFGALADAPRHTCSTDLVPQTGLGLAPLPEDPVCFAPVTSARPRAPPLS